MKHTHTCSCGAAYASDDPDPYFCAACVKKRKQIAAKLDAKLAGHQPKKRERSDWEILRETGQLPSGDNGSMIFIPKGRVQLNDLP